MDDPDADMKFDVAIESALGGVRYPSPLLTPAPVLLRHREVAAKHPQKTINQLNKVTEESLIYRKFSQTSCQLPGPPKSTFLMAFSPDGSKVASTHGDHNIYVSEVKTGECICTLEGHPRTPWCVAFHPASNEIIASGCLGGEVRVWDLKGGSEVWTTEKDTVIASLAFHPTDQVLVIATFNEIYFWDWSEPQPFATIATSDEKEKVRYVKFDPLGHKLITGIANTVDHRSGNRNSSSNLSRLELVAREIRLNYRYNELSSRFRDLMSRYEALTTSALNNNNNNTPQLNNRVDRGTDPIEPPPISPTLGQQASLNQARQYAQQVTQQERRPNMFSQNSSSPRNQSTWANSEFPNTRELQGSSHSRMEEYLGSNLVRPLRQIISDDSASSSSLDSTSSATSGTSGISERNTRLSLLLNSRPPRSGQDSDSTGDTSSVHSLGDSNPLSGAVGGVPLAVREETVVTSSENNNNNRPHLRNAIDQRSENDMLDQTESNSLHRNRPASLWGYYSSLGVIRPDRTRSARERRSGRNLDVNNRPNDISLIGTQTDIDNNRPENDSESSGNSQRNATSNLSSTGARRRRNITSRRTLSSNYSRLRHSSSLFSVNGENILDPDEDLAIPGPSGLSGGSLSSSQSTFHGSSRYATSSSAIDPQFGVQLLSGHIENMQRICRAHLEITRHRHEIHRLQQIRSMLYDIQHQIHSLRASVDQSIEDISGSLVDLDNAVPRSTRRNEEESRVPPLNSGSSAHTPRSSYSTLRHSARITARSVARLQRGPFGTRTRSRHNHGSWSMSSGLFRRIPRIRSSRTRYHLPGISTPSRGTNEVQAESREGRASPTSSVSDPLNSSTAISGAAIGPLPTPPPDQQPRDIVRIVAGDSNTTETRTLQERLRIRQEALEQQERRLRGFLGNSPSSSSSTTSVSLDQDDDPPSPPAERLRRRVPTTSLSSRINNMLQFQSANSLNNTSNPENSSQWYSSRRRLRQSIVNQRRDMLLGRSHYRSGGPYLFPVSRLRSRSASAERMHLLIREGLRRDRRDRYRQILRHMADRLNTLVNQEQEQHDQLALRQNEEQLSGDASNGDQASSNSSMDNHMENLRLLVRLALHLIDQLLNFICNQNVSYEERPISRLPNPFRDEEISTSAGSTSTADNPRSDLASSIDLDLSPGLQDLTTLFETVRMASGELQNEEARGAAESGEGNSNSTQGSSRNITNIPRRLTDFLRRSGNFLASQQSTDPRGDPWASLPTGFGTRPHLVIPRITLSDPSGSESQVDDEAAADNAATSRSARTSYNDRSEFSTRSMSGMPLRLLGRQYAIDRRSPDTEDNATHDGVDDGHNPIPDLSFPWRGSGEPGLLRPPFSPRGSAADRASEREADNFFNRAYYAAHPASRAMAAPLITHRIQAWDFTNYRIPDISDGLANVVVAKCKIHNDASVDVSPDGTLLAALVPENQATIMVGVYSLEKRSLGQLLYSYIFPHNTICVSISPVARHLVVGFCSQMPRLVNHDNTKQLIAKIYKLCDTPTFHGQAGDLVFLRDIEVVCDHRHTSLNCIRWLPYPGQGLIYGNNRGQLNILR